VKFVSACDWNVMGERIALRIDDIGASSKRYEVYSDTSWQFGEIRFSGNWLFFKYLPPFKKWGPYREMNVTEWQRIFEFLDRANAKLTVGITAAWVESETKLISFPQKFPDIADVLRKGLEDGLLEIANHGLTHCVLKANAFKPKWFDGNRLQHREFWGWLPAEVHEEHIRRSQEILKGFFKTEIVTLIPPGNVFSEITVRLARKHGIRFFSTNVSGDGLSGIEMINPDSVVAFHDRDIILGGLQWFQKLLARYKDSQKVFVRELAKDKLASNQVLH
jgi:peptidoglycan/xylan/chitin deacetylase (PgdA/CDA1 family)